ncbi:MAG: hypothetical protein PHT75_01075 [Bacilli bacterium]|nr:hypothetical protein [Bacilli bacterium]MDD3304707.1 hypothetical protein [Bacilli bacterium]MDD4053614.1 hypothetical protein [Bacilli bacterium]MDD4411113.1 hypothetical protein [Bacilli bacterium]
MNSKVSFFNIKYLLENFKKSRGVIYLFLLIIPIFTYLFMLMLNNSLGGDIYFANLSDLSIPAIIGMYIIPFTMSVTLFNFLFRKDSVDFITALPLKRSTIFITNIIGGILIFLAIFLITSLLMLLSSTFFPSLVIPKMMYFHFFITFFIAYTYTFIASSLALVLTGSRIAHVALTLIILFIPGYIGDFYNSGVYHGTINEYDHIVCDRYDEECDDSKIYNDFVVEKSYMFENGQTLPYKYINVIPRDIFGMYSNEVTYQNELASVYNTSSNLRMIILSIIYFVLGLYAFVNRKMEVAESTFKSENIHQLVKCITLFPLALATISIFCLGGSVTGLIIMIAVTVTIYIIYDLIMRRNSGNFMKSLIYFLGLVLVTMLIYLTIDKITNLESSKIIEREDIASVGIAPSMYFDYNLKNNLDILKYKLEDSKIIDLIYDNNQRAIATKDLSTKFAVRFNLKNGATYYFNVAVTKIDYDELIKLLDKDQDYVKAFKSIPYDKVYGVKLGNSYLDDVKTKKVVNLIKEGYQNKTVSDIVDTSYIDYEAGYSYTYSLINTLYSYDGGVKTYNVSTMINPKLINYVMQTKNTLYIENVKNKNVNINQLSISIDFSKFEEINDYEEFYHKFMSNPKNMELVYRYINDNVKGDLDFSSYSEEEIIYVSVWVYDEYYVFLPKDDAYDEMLQQIKENVLQDSNSKIEFGEGI